MDQNVVYFNLSGSNLEILTRGVNVNDALLNMSEAAIHLGHHMPTKDNECTVNTAKIDCGDLII